MLFRTMWLIRPRTSPEGNSPGQGCAKRKLTFRRRPRTSMQAGCTFRAPRSIPPTGLRPWVPPAHEAAGGHGPLGITPGLQDTLTGTVTG